MSISSDKINKEKKSDNLFTKKDIDKMLKILSKDSTFYDDVKSGEFYSMSPYFLVMLSTNFIRPEDADILEKIFTLAEKNSDSYLQMHKLYTSMLNDCYKGVSKNPSEISMYLCELLCKRDIDIFPLYSEEWNIDYDYTKKIKAPSFQRLSAIYERNGKFKEAIKINELALSYECIEDRLSYQSRIIRLWRRLMKF